jgi:hypothetical protein
MSQIVLHRTRYFDSIILPKLDELARGWSCTRSDAIRAILYANFKYPLPQKSAEQIEEIYTIEADMERDYGKDGYVVIYIDSAFEDMLARRRARYYHAECNIIVQNIVCRYLGVYPEALPAIESPYVYGIKSGPCKGRVMVKKVQACKS